MRKMMFNGQFYSNNKNKLEDFFKSIKVNIKEQLGYGIIAPHAGYVYSGITAFKTYKSIIIPDKCLIFCPNHRGYGEAVSVSVEDWETPFGIVENDKELTKLILKMPFAKEDKKAHYYEHSLEVQLPILKYLNPNAKICAVSIGIHDYEILNKIAIFLGNELKNDTLLIASSDMSHFISSDRAKKLDSEVINLLEKLDSKNMLKEVKDKNITMCGVAPAFIVASVSKLLGASKGEVVEYTNSGKVTGDFNDVVAYLGMRFV